MNWTRLKRKAKVYLGRRPKTKAIAAATALASLLNAAPGATAKAAEVVADKVAAYSQVDPAFLPTPQDTLSDEEWYLMGESRPVMKRPNGTRYVQGALEVVLNPDLLKLYTRETGLPQVFQAGQFSPVLARLLGEEARVELSYLNPERPSENAVTILVDKGADLGSLTASLFEAGLVKRAGALSYAPFAYVPNDPEVPSQYGLAPARSDIFAAWDALLPTFGRSDVCVGVVDTGGPDPLVDVTLDACEDVSGSPNGCWDVQGHGTRVFGVLGANIDNGVCTAGLYNGCKVAVKADDSIATTGTQIAAGMYKARDLGSMVEVVAWQGSSPSVTQATLDLTGGGVVVVGSACNDGVDTAMGQPADMEEAIGVGSIDANGNRPASSCYGPNIDIVAPGVSIPTTVPPPLLCNGFSGNSASAPFIGGVAALYRAHLRNLGICADTPADVKNALLSTAKPLPSGNPDTWQYGAGEVNGDPNTGFLSVRPSCKTVVQGAGSYDCGGNPVFGDLLGVGYGQPIKTDAIASGPTAPIYPDPGCVLNVRVYDAANGNPLIPWQTSGTGLLIPATATGSWVAQSKYPGEEQYGCVQQGTPWQVTLVPNNVETVEVGSDRTVCEGQPVSVSPSVGLSSSPNFCGNYSVLGQWTNPQGQGVGLFSTNYNLAIPTADPLTDNGTWTLDVLTENQDTAMREPLTRRQTDTFVLTVTPDVQAGRVTNLKVVKAPGGLDVTFDNQAGIANYQLQGSTNPDSSTFTTLEDVVASPGPTTTTFVSNTGLPPGSALYLGEVGKSTCTGTPGPK